MTTKKRLFWSNILMTVYRKLSRRSLFALSKTILRLSVPASAASVIAPVGSVIDTGTIFRGIAAAFSDHIPGQAGIPSAQELSQEAVRLMGMLSKGDSILNLPLTLNTAFMTMLVPTVSGLLASGRKKAAMGKIEESLRMTVLLILPCAAGLMALTQPIPAVNIYGAPIASAACYPTGFLFGFHRLRNTAHLSRSFSSSLLRTASCASVMGGGARPTYLAIHSLLGSNTLALLITIAGPPSSILRCFSPSIRADR